MADPNTGDTMVQALNTAVLWFIIALDVTKHIQRLQKTFRYLHRLPGDAVTNEAQIRHAVMNSFPKRWQ